ncbi:hypothetical protein FIBSPDRAFT_961127 [Athelia psychrophila]|uniref:Ribonuclease H1 N-terminal domain-containing protein n=1 Tax=Athelia psychrophila TaxID=1759441 RepID=A0A166BN25_9AGAM|nr:hypothetical protein FIBSPDRAFT_961127 [Fibularhizoctonia sp. CBS 109695]
MPTILYAEHHRDDQVLNDLLATLRVADPTQPIQSAAPSANTKPKIPASSAPAPGSSSSGPLNSNTNPPPPPGPSERTYTVRGRETGIIDTWHHASHASQGFPGGKATQIQSTAQPSRRRHRRAVYVVYEGLEPGIYYSWDDVEPLVGRVPHANFEGFDSPIQAERAYIAAYTMGAIRRLPPRDAPASFVPPAVAMPAHLVQKLAALPANYLHAEWYVVFKGRAPGIYPTWGMTLTQVTGVSLAAFQRYPSKPEASAAFEAARRAGADECSPSNDDDLPFGFQMHSEYEQGDDEAHQRPGSLDDAQPYALCPQHIGSC